MSDAERFCQFLRHWHAYEQTLPSKLMIVDMDLAPQPAEPWDRKKVRAAIEQFSFRGPEESRRKACLTLLEVLAGEELGMRELTMRCAEYTPEYTPEELLESLREELDSLAEERGFSYPQELPAMLKRERLATEEIEPAYREHAKLLSGLAAWLGAEVPEYSTRIVSEDAYWTNWMHADERGEFLLSLNTHPTKKWTTTKIDYLLLHEVGGHFMQVAGWQEAMRKGRLSSAWNINTLFSGEAWLMEGVAMILPLLYPDAPLGARFVAVHTALEMLVGSDAYLRWEDGSSLAEVKEWGASVLPSLPPENFDRHYKSWQEDPVMRIYIPAYADALKLLLVLRDADEQTQRHVLRRLYSDVLFRPGVEELLDAFL